MLNPRFLLISSVGRILLPLKETIEHRRSKSANNFPPTEDTEKEVPENRRHVFLDMVYAARAYRFNEKVLSHSIAFPAVRNMASHDLYPPYHSLPSPDSLSPTFYHIYMR